MTGPFHNAMKLMAENGFVGLVWADASQQIIGQLGVLADEAVIGTGICETLVPLIGLEDQVASLARHNRQPLVMANVSVIGASGEAVRRNYTVMWFAAERQFLVSITPALALGELAVNLEQGLRREFQLKAQLAAQADVIAETNKQLARTNADLVDFTRIVSHDLKAPMRAIRYSADLVEAAIAEPEATDPQGALDTLRGQTRRLSDMVTELLAYSRLTHKTEAATRLDTGALVAEIIAAQPRPESLAVECVGDWPTITTIKPLFDLVIRNLLENAIKHHDCADGRIEISCVASDSDVLVINVRDDGPGIPDRYLDAVFKPFVQLDPEKGAVLAWGLPWCVRPRRQPAARLLPRQTHKHAERRSHSGGLAKLRRKSGGILTDFKSDYSSLRHRASLCRRQ